MMRHMKAGNIFSLLREGSDEKLAFRLSCNFPQRQKATKLEEERRVSRQDEKLESERACMGVGAGGNGM